MVTEETFRSRSLRFKRRRVLESEETVEVFRSLFHPVVNSIEGYRVVLIFAKPCCIYAGV